MLYFMGCLKETVCMAVEKGGPLTPADPFDQAMSQDVNEAHILSIYLFGVDAKGLGAAAMVTPCPLCHLSLDGRQPDAAAARKTSIDLPILHLPQLIGLALGIDPKAMRLNKHIVSTKRLLSELALAP